MDIVWIAAVAVLWVAVAEMVVGLNKLASPKGREKTQAAAPLTQGATLRADSFLRSGLKRFPFLAAPGTNLAQTSSENMTHRSPPLSWMLPPWTNMWVGK